MSDIPENTEPSFEIPGTYIRDGKILGEYQNVNELLDAFAAQGGAPEAPEAPGVDLSAPQIGETAETPTLPVEDLQIPQTRADLGDGVGLESAAELYNEARSNGGQLTEATLEVLAEKGITAEVAQLTLQAVESKMQMEASQIAEAVGGKDKIDAAFRWAQTTMSANEVDQINAALDAGSQVARESIIRDLINRSGVAATRVEGGLAQQPGPAPFSSRDDFIAAQKDPRYKTSESFRAEVMQRLKGKTW